MGILVSESFTQADGRVEIELGMEATFHWHQIGISIYDNNGNPAGIASGTLAGEALKIGFDVTDIFTDTLDLGAGDRGWFSETAGVRSFFFTPTGLPSDRNYIVTVDNWGL